MDNLSRYALALESLLKDQGWDIPVVNTRGWSNLEDKIGYIPHPDVQLLNYYRKDGASVIMKMDPWFFSQRDADVKQGCHLSANEYKTFLWGEKMNMFRRAH